MYRIILSVNMCKSACFCLFLSFPSSYFSNQDVADMLKRRGESRYPCLTPDFSGNAFFV